MNVYRVGIMAQPHPHLRDGPYPVTLDAEPPARFERPQLVLRVVLLVALGLLGFSIGWLLLALYLALPAVAAVLISRKGAERFIAEDSRVLTRVLDWVVAFFAYLVFVTDRFPIEVPARRPRLQILPGGRPTPASALLRLVTSLPSALVLTVLGIGAALVWVLAALWVLASETYPGPLFAYQRGVLRWLARLFAYHASLVEPYPPFTLDTGAAPRMLGPRREEEAPI